MVLLSLLPPAISFTGNLLRVGSREWLGGGGASASWPRFFLLHGRLIQTRLCSSLKNSDSDIKIAAKQSEIIFLGTGTSEGIPRVSCLTNPLKNCMVCQKATEPGNKNRRRNTSILIRYASDNGKFNILVDAGTAEISRGIVHCPVESGRQSIVKLKLFVVVFGTDSIILAWKIRTWKQSCRFFYHSALTWFPIFGLRNIDAVIITHSHADAIGGLDDLRDWTNNVQPFIPIYVAKHDFEVMKMTHYYLVDTSVVLEGAAVSELQFNMIKEEPFIVHNLKVTPLPVWHGHGYRSLGFRFGDICYISDVSEIPEETYLLLKDCDLLILDALRPDRSSSTHFGLPRALEEVRKIRPKRTLFTGMMHLMDHEKISEDLAKLKKLEGLDLQLSYDGLTVPVNL